MEFHLLLLDDSLDLCVLGTDDLQQIFGESLRTCNLLFIWATDVPSSVQAGQSIPFEYERDVNIHRLISFSSCLLIHETGTEALDLHPCLGLLLDIFHKNTLIPRQHCTTRTDSSVAHRWSNNLRPNIEISYRLKTNGELLLRPFAL